MKLVKNVLSITFVVAVATFIAAWLAVESRAQAPDKSALGGVWTLNRELSDQPPAPERRRDGDESGRRGGYGRGHGMGRGGFGGGMGRGGMNGDPEQMARMRDAMRDALSPPDHLTIVQTDTMIALTGPDGRTTRLSPDGKKIKDENTKAERKSRWDGSTLVSELTGLGPGRITQSFSVDPDTHRLRITIESEGGRRNQPRTITYVYDPAT